MESLATAEAVAMTPQITEQLFSYVLSQRANILPEVESAGKDISLTALPTVPSAIEEAQAHISTIRRARGLDVEEGQDLGINVDDLISALTLLSEQLYTQPTHFLLEFIQNADDNNYDDDILPSLSFTHEPGFLSIDCNETGFQAANVDAVCRISQSTKKDRTKGFIGEKGIGFKSVFKIADVVWISSNAYAFKFDRNAFLGMVAPIWAEFPNPVNAEGTQFYLQLQNDVEAEKDLKRDLRKLDSTLLLFLRSLRQIEVFISDGTLKGSFKSFIRRTDYTGHGGEMITISKTWSTVKRADEKMDYFVIRHIAKDIHLHQSTPLPNLENVEQDGDKPKVANSKDEKPRPFEEKRIGITSSEVVLAFPFSENKPAFHRQKAYAFLPIRESGFRFLLQADFVLIANREDLNASNQWNELLLRELAACFEKAVHRFNSTDAHALRYAWPGFLQDVPNVESNTFLSLGVLIFDRLRDLPILVSQKCDELISPSSAIFVPHSFRDASGDFVLGFATDQAFVSPNYDLHDPEQKLLKKLGVEVMEFSWFLELLKKIISDKNEVFITQPTEWHSVVSQILLDNASAVEMRALQIIPLQDGRWIRQVDAEAHFETDDAKILGSIPEGVPDLLLVTQSASRDPVRHELLLKLGVKDLNQREVCRLIAKVHADNVTLGPNLTVDVLISHVTYLFEVSRSGYSVGKDCQIWVCDLNGQTRKAGSIYLDSVSSDVPPVSSYLQPEKWASRLLHPSYLLAYKGKNRLQWVKWLELALGIHSIVRIADLNNDFTAEFLHIKDTLPTSQFLEILMSSWLKNSTYYSLTTIRQRIGALEVTCEGGEKIRLSKTCLPINSLKSCAPAGVSFVQLANPTRSKWQSLQEFGVVIKPDLDFYLLCLQLTQGKKVTRAQMNVLYKKIHANWLQSPSKVSDHFRSNFAIYLPDSKRWVPKSACVWSSTPGVTGMHQLSDLYPELHSFFFHCLKIPSASIEDVISTLLAMTPPGQDDPDKRKVLICTLSEFLRRTPKDYAKLRALQDKPVMPVVNPGDPSSTLLKSLNKATWVFADRHQYFDSFKDKITFAAFPVEQYPRLEPLNDAIQKAWGAAEQSCFSSLVREEKDHGTNVSFSIDKTTYLRSKVKYLRRIVKQSNTRRNPDISRKLELLHHLEVHLAPEMVSKPVFERGQIGKPINGRPIAAEAMYRESVNIVRFYLRIDRSMRTPIPIPELSEELCKFCGIQDERLRNLVMQILIKSNPNQIEDTLARAKIGGHEDYDYEAAPVPLKENVQVQGKESGTNLSKTKTARPDATAPGIEAKQPDSELSSIVECLSAPTPLRKRDVEKYVISIQGFSTDTSAENCGRTPAPAARIPEVKSTRRRADVSNNQNRSSDTEHYQNPLRFAGPSKGSPSPSTSLPPGAVRKANRDYVREHSIGYNGERMVFETLRRVFGNDLDKSCWTSELRELAGEGFDCWTPEDSSTTYCDFTIVDKESRLSSWLSENGTNVSRGQNLERPATYHIEVKTTAGPCHEPFHMSSLQMEKCEALSARSAAVVAGGGGGNSQKNEIFLIFRVFDVETTEPEFKVYADPWTMFKKSELIRQADSWLVQEY